MSILESRTDHVRECFGDDTSTAVRVRLLRLSDYDNGFLEKIGFKAPAFHRLCAGHDYQHPKSSA